MDRRDQLFAIGDQLFVEVAAQIVPAYSHDHRVVGEARALAYGAKDQKAQKLEAMLGRVVVEVADRNGAPAVLGRTQQNIGDNLRVATRPYDDDALHTVLCL